MRKHKLNYQEWDIVWVCIFIKDLPHKWKHRYCRFKCPCWKDYDAYLFIVKDENSTCCKFYKKQPKMWFRMDTHPLYTVWRWMLRRCNKSNCKHYYNYWGRWISVCDEWNKFEHFYNFWIINWWEKWLEIDRVDNNWNYEPKNCRFVTRKVNDNNRRTCRYIAIWEDTKTVTEWAEYLWINVSTFRYRIRSWITWDALKRPTKAYKYN